MMATTACAGGCKGPDVSSQTSNSRAHAESRSSAHQHGHGDIEAYIARMESPDRAKWQKPNEVIAALDLKLGERVADVGCGPGYFTLPLARTVGPKGRVWAVDIEPKMLDRLRQHVAKAKLNNIEYVLAPQDNPSLPEGHIDTILIVNTYHHFEYRPAYLSRLRHALTGKGRIVIIDFVPKSPDERGFGPPLEMQLPVETVDAELASAGFEPAARHTFLPEQYFVEYRVRK